MRRLRFAIIAAFAACVIASVWLPVSQPLSSPAWAFDKPGGAGLNGEEAPGPGKARDDVWPKPVEEFMAGEYLDKADIMLTRRSGDIASSIIRWATGSEFSHAALVYTAPPYDAGIGDTFVIEAGTSGVDLTKLTDYVRDDRVSFVGIRRLKPKPWFTAARQARVRGLLLDKIKARYDFWTIWKIARQIWFGVQTKMGSRERTVQSYREKDWQPPNEYICSGLVQIGFVETLIEAIRKGEIPPDALSDVVFSKAAEKYLPEPGKWSLLGEDAKSTAELFRDVLNDELYAVTPEDLAQTDKLDWIYLIKSGNVYKVDSYNDVLELVR